MAGSSGENVLRGLNDVAVFHERPLNDPKDRGLTLSILIRSLSIFFFEG